MATNNDPFGWFTPKPQPTRVNPTAVIGGSMGGFEDFETIDIQNPDQDIQITVEKAEIFNANGSLKFNETVVKKIIPTVPGVGEKVIKATELTGKAAEDVAEAGLDLLKQILGFEAKPKKVEKPEDKAKAAENQMKQQAMNETARRVNEVARERQTKNNMEEYRKQVNKVLGITSSFEGTMDEHGQIRTDIKISFEKAQTEQDAAAKKAAKEKAMAAIKPKGVKVGQGVDLRQSAMTEKTAGGSALTTVG